MGLRYYFLLITLITSLCSNTYAQWSRINPLPQENSITDLKLIPETGRIFATCENSTIMYSDNDGDTWNLIINPANMADDYLCNSIYFINSSVGFITGGQKSILKTTDGGVTWSLKYIMPSKPNSSILHDIAFFNNTTGFAVADSGLLLKTIDAGETWLVTESDYLFDLTNIEILNDSTAFICNGGSSLLKTTNSGEIWFTLDSIPGLPEGNISNLIFCNDQSGFLLMEYEDYDYDIFKTIDGGETWTLCTIEKILNIFHGKFASYDAQHVVLTGPCYAYCNIAFMSSDGGITWSSSFTPIDWGNEAVCYTSEIDILSAGVGGSIARSHNGTSWLREDVREISGDLINLEIVDNSTAFAACILFGGGTPDQRLYKTNDKGLNWSELELPINYQATILIDFIDSLKGFACGNYGEFRYTNDGANSWEDRTSLNDDLEPSKISFNTELDGFAISQSSVFKTNDGAFTWDDVTPGNYSFIDIEYKSADTLFIMCTRGDVTYILKTIDGGTHWEEITQLTGYAYDLFLTESDTAYLLTSNNLFRSVDNCSSWSQLPLSFDQIRITSVFFTTNNTGYLIGYSETNGRKMNTLLKTTDAGMNWGELETNTTSYFKFIGFFDSQSSLLAGENGLILSTENGGGNVSVPYIPYKEDAKFTVYPNPTTGMVTLKCENNVNSTLRITDLTGRILQTGRINKKETKIDISTLQPGVYLFSLEEAGSVKVTKK